MESRKLRIRQSIAGKNIFIFSCGLVIIAYFLTDIIHFIQCRAISQPYDNPLVEAFFESPEISIVKWIFCIGLLLGLFFEYKNMSSEFFLIPSAVGVISSLVLNGRIDLMIKGSPLYNFLLLEVVSVIIFIYALRQLIYNKRISLSGYIIIFIISSFIVVIISILPKIIIPSYY